MARRRRRRGRRKPPKLGFIIFQIVVLLALLVAIVEVRDSIAEGTSAVIGQMFGEDVQVRDRQDLEETDFPGSQTDDGAVRGPAVPVDQPGEDADEQAPN